MCVDYSYNYSNLYSLSRYQRTAQEVKMSTRGMEVITLVLQILTLIIQMTMDSNQFASRKGEVWVIAKKIITISLLF